MSSDTKVGTRVALEMHGQCMGGIHPDRFGSAARSQRPGFSYLTAAAMARAPEEINLTQSPWTAAKQKSTQRVLAA